MQFEYGGDDGCPIVSWFSKHLRSVECCFGSGLPEASLTLLYSGIDTLGLLGAPPEVKEATGATFICWCEQYLVQRLKSIDGKSLTALEIYGARCGVLHTSSPVSKSSRAGECREVWYQFRGESSVNLGLNAKLEPLTVDIAHFAIAFAESGKAFVTVLNGKPALLTAARDRARSFFRWGRQCGT